ncbi:hypothetical protein ABZ694_31180 [Streptomyces albidoflavus]|uniref:hypothetical protein n=1 Tax=Streptomyces albidoflavus TaxID=1886 RepID=UPI00340B29B5
MRQQQAAFDLDVFECAFPDPEQILALGGSALRAAVDTGVVAFATMVGTSAERVHSRLVRTVRISKTTVPDDLDRQEMLRILRTWRTDPSTYRPPVALRRPHRPEGIGQLPAPRVIKPAHLHVDCGLCCDAVKAGDLMGRFRQPKDLSFTAMGWLCGHCLYARRETPRRRDILLRIYHHLFAGSATGFNAYECEVLETWLAEPALTNTTAWRTDPLENTLARLRDSVEEQKATTWVADPTCRTIVSVLAHTDLTPQEKSLLRSVDQHLTEWRTNPQGLETRRFGTGLRYRVEVLRTTPNPTELSKRGGPFDLHQSPAPAPEDDDEAPAPDDQADS